MANRHNHSSMRTVDLIILKLTDTKPMQLIGHSNLQLKGHPGGRTTTAFRNSLQCNITALLIVNQITNCTKTCNIITLLQHKNVPTHVHVHVHVHTCTCAILQYYNAVLCLMLNLYHDRCFCFFFPDVVASPPTSISSASTITPIESCLMSSDD